MHPGELDLELVHEPARGPPLPPGLPVLFVHGSWHGAWCWRKWFSYLADRGVDCWALSLRGHGRSGGKLAGARMADYVQDVRWAIEEVRRRSGTAAQPVLVGHSLGSTLIQAHAETAPAPPAGLALLGDGKGSSVWPVLRYMVKHPGPFLRCHVRRSTFETIATPALAREALFSAGLPEGELRGYHALLCEESYELFLDEALGRSDVRRDRVRSNLAGRPVLVLCGREDACVGRGEAEALAAEYGAEAVLLDACPHDLMLDLAWRPAADALLAWLTRAFPR